MTDKHISPKLKDIFNQLSHQVTNLSWKWQTFNMLFGDSAEKVDLLNKTAGNFFHLVQLMLQNDFLLILSRITDPSKLGGQENLVINSLLENLNEDEHPKFYNEFKIEIERVKNLCKPFKIYRNKTIAHNDLFVKLKYEKEPLPGIPIDNIKKAIEALQNTMNIFSAYFFDSTTYYDEVFENCGTKSLFTYLQKGWEYYESEKTVHMSAHDLTRHST
jgi:hypothetical protein